ncbi:unnamed protein product [Trifolium pratense]|uniref:Uncharacterized protein n=1 Tax=Trifolium pratense TaxID=57577 RepID=A0ACB0K6Q9_TRIPR|nr:unnamed protein product [Trifolium pratense]
MDFEFLDDLAIEGQLRITSQLIEVRLPLIHSRPSAAAKMATSDLLNELTKPTFMTVPDLELELKLKIINIQQLDDAAGDVSGLAVKCLALLVRKMNEPRVVEMSSQLCDKILNGKDQHRDTAASIALKTVVAYVSPPLAHSILSVLSPQLIKGFAGKVSPSNLPTHLCSFRLYQLPFSLIYISL